MPLRRTSQGLAFRAPPTMRSGPVDEQTQHEIAAVLGVERAELIDAQWADNGPGWVAVERPAPRRCSRSSRAART